MIQFRPNRPYTEDDSYDPTLDRIKGDTFSLMPQVQNIQASTQNEIQPLLGTSEKQKHVDGLVHDMNIHIQIIRRNGDRGQADHLEKRVQALSSEPLNDDTIRSLEELQQHITMTAQAFDE